MSVITLNLVFVLALIALSVALAIRWTRVRRERRLSAWRRRYTDVRFTARPSEIRKHYDQYDTPAILRKQAE